MTASVQDVATQLGRPIDDPLEINQVTAWIEMAELAIRQRYSNLDQLIADKRISQNAVNMVEASAVARHSLNPEGYTSKSERIDDYQRTYGMTNSAVGITFTDTEWALLTPSDSGAEGAFTITPMGRRPYESRYSHDRWT
jgi:hypothetical protein|nr:MAG TPA: hypothetical protein [Caudoviricetes sp.]